jgi:WD40 repeat protein
VTGGGRFEDPRQLVRHLAPCQLVAFSPDSRLVLTASLDCIVRVHDVASCKQLQQFSVSDDGGGQLPQQQHGGGAAGASAASAAAAVVAVSWFPDSRRFLAATRKALAIYDAHQSGGPQRRLAPAHTFTYDAVVGPGGGCIISIGQDKQIAFHR